MGIVIVTHGRTGKSLVNDTEFILGQSLDDIRFIHFKQSGDQRVPPPGFTESLDDGLCVRC